MDRTLKLLFEQSPIPSVVVDALARVLLDPDHDPAESVGALLPTGPAFFSGAARFLVRAVPAGLAVIQWRDSAGCLLGGGGGHLLHQVGRLVDGGALVHVFLRGKKNTEHVLTVVCRKSANLGMVLSKAKACLPDVEAAV